VIAKLALYPVSEDLDDLMGQIFTIDGGLEMNWRRGA
jgi:hypothetical protein